MSLALGKKGETVGDRGNEGVCSWIVSRMEEARWFRLSPLLPVFRPLDELPRSTSGERPRNGGMRRAILGKTSKLHFQRLKLFPYDVRQGKRSVADWLHEYLARSSTDRAEPDVLPSGPILRLSFADNKLHSDTCVYPSLLILSPSLVPRFHRSRTPRSSALRFLSRERSPRSSRRSFHFYTFSCNLLYARDFNTLFHRGKFLDNSIDCNLNC